MDVFQSWIFFGRRYIFVSKNVLFSERINIFILNRRFSKAMASDIDRIKSINSNLTEPRKSKQTLYHLHNITIWQLADSISSFYLF